MKSMYFWKTKNVAQTFLILNIKKIKIKMSVTMQKRVTSWLLQYIRVGTCIMYIYLEEQPV